MIVQKFGGSSVADVACIQRVAEIVLETRAKGHDVVVVVSAMGDETDRLLQLSAGLSSTIPDREYAALLSTGEQVSAALLASALSAKGVLAKSYQGFQLPIKTNTDYRQAHIDAVDVSALEVCFESTVVPVVTGFQGVNAGNEITTLGRGGSDVTAVAIAAALHAEECQIFTDVAGVYTADPRIVPSAERIPSITYDEMLTFASLGAKVLQDRSVEMARKHALPLRVLSSFAEGEGTLLKPAPAAVPAATVSGIACVQDQVQVVYDPAVQEGFLEALTDSGIYYEMPHQSSVVIHADDLVRLSTAYNCQYIDGLARVSLVGLGMEHHARLAARIFQELEALSVAIHAVTSTPFQVSILVAAAEADRIMNCLHQALVIAIPAPLDSVS